MNYKRKHNRRTVIRKGLNPTASIGEWSRMLHKWWKRDVMDKIEFKKTQ